MTRRFLWLVTALAVAAGCASTTRAGRVPRAGLVVVSLSADGLAGRAGIAPGDVLLSWRRGDAGGELVSPIDLDRLWAEEAPRGAVTCAGLRGEEAVAFELGEGSWGLNVRPRLGQQPDRELDEASRVTGPEAAARLRGLALAEERSAVRAWLLVQAAETAGLEGGVGLWAEAVASAGDDAMARAWVHERHGRTLQASQRFDEAAAAYGLALESRPHGSLTAAVSLHQLGMMSFYRGDLDAAEAHHRHALEIRERLVPESLLVAESLNSLGIAAGKRGDLESAEQHLNRALEIRERLAPGSVETASCLSNLGNVAQARSDLETADELYRRALEIQERLAPGSMGVASYWNNLGVVALHRGDLPAAEEDYRRALEIRERHAPGSLQAADSLDNLGVAAALRGDLEMAEQYHRRALEINQRLAPDSLDVAFTLNNLGVVAKQRSDLAATERYYRQALEIEERIAPGSHMVAASYDSLGGVACERGDLETAESYHQRALEVFERLLPGGLEAAAVMENLGEVAHRRGELDLAGERYRRALEIRERVSPGDLSVADSLGSLGALARERGDLAAAESSLSRALEIHQRLAPGSTNQGSAYHELARVLRAAGRRSEALDALRRAVAALEAQQRRLGGTAEQLGEFRARHLEIYRDLVDLLLEEGLPEEAFGVLESARARALLAMLAERDLVTSDVPAELERERRIANADSERALAALGRLAAEGSEEERARLLAELDAIAERQEEVRARIRAASPRLAELRYPESLDLAAARQTLDPGSVLLELSLGSGSGHLFVVGPGPDRFAAYLLPIGEEELRNDVEQLRRLVERWRLATDGPIDASGSEALTRALRSLSETLLGPAREELAECTRVIVVPDGPLHVLPLAALLEPTAGTGRYLVEDRPISVVASATVLAQLQKQRRPLHDTRVIAFGDPSYPAATSEGDSPALEQAVRSGLSLDPLPATRAEVEGLGELLGEHATLWLGAEATEERAKSVGQEFTIVHFAAHGLVDEQRPLSSALALTIPEQAVEGQDNGLLQAWEIFEQVRLDADLVVLSACETALGKEVAGEGILGLTRAFQYAGARSVLASLWSVADESTAELMRRFYGNLNAGMAKDEALRQAQLAFIHGPIKVGACEGAVDRDLSHPFYWAAFQLYGDWR